MLTTERPEPDNPVAASARAPRIAPCSATLDRQHRDLSFSIDTGGRRFYRVLVAREPGLFTPGQAGARSAANFHDSALHGLQPDDGPPTFYMVPRSVIDAMLPAKRLYYTVIAYEDHDGARAAYALAPSRLAADAPSITVAAELVAGSLGFMFGTHVSHLRGVTGGSAWAIAAEETGEDLAPELPAALGLEADDDDGAVSSYAAALDAAAMEEIGEDLGIQMSDDGDGDGDGDADAHAYAAGSDEYDDGYAGAVHDDASASAYADFDTDSHAAAYADDADEPPRADGDAGAVQALDDDYDDGYGLPSHPAARSESYGAEHDAESGAPASSYDSAPDMLPDDDERMAHGAADDEHDSNEVSIEGVAESYAAVALPETRVPFDIDACKTLLARIMPFESGSDGFARIEPDGEFAGRYGSAHPAYQRYHLGLTFGAFPFVQEHGTLGELLVMMRQRDEATFVRIFGPGTALIDVTTDGQGPRAWESPDGLSPRLRPVENALLWQEPWLTRFREAGHHPQFQGAQNELAARRYVLALLPFAAQVGLDSDQALTLLVDRAVQMGPEAASAWVLQAASPLATTAQRQAALGRLGLQGVRELQVASKLPVSGQWDTATQAALIGRLRAEPERSPVPMPTRTQWVDAIVRRAADTPWADRVQRLRDAGSAERVFQF